jgi:hypothetical protein
MTNEEIYKYIGIVINEEEWDGTWSIDEYNNITKAVATDFAKTKIKELFSNRAQLPIEVLYSHELLKNQIKTETITPTTGVIDISSGGDLANDYAAWGYMFTNDLKPVDLVEFSQFKRRQTDLLTPHPSKHPVAVIYNDTIKVYPTNISSVEFSYIKSPTIPFFDYYIDANNNVQYLTEGQSAYTLQANEVYRDGTSTGSVTSITKEPEWPESYMKDYINFLLAELGISSQNQPAYQHAQVEQQKDQR